MTQIFSSNQVWWCYQAALLFEIFFFFIGWYAILTIKIEIICRDLYVFVTYLFFVFFFFHTMVHCSGKDASHLNCQKHHPTPTELLSRCSEAHIFQTLLYFMVIFTLHLFRLTQRSFGHESGSLGSVSPQQPQWQAQLCSRAATISRLVTIMSTIKIVDD